jgi:hypothetical protein
MSTSAAVHSDMTGGVNPTAVSSDHEHSSPDDSERVSLPRRFRKLK